MTRQEHYHQYLNSPAWAAKRARCFFLDNYRCSNPICQTADKLQAHHLTYERIFHEDEGDLMTLCEACHKAAEFFVAKGLIARRGNPEFLRKLTIERISGKPEKVREAPLKEVRDYKGMECRNPTQRNLMSIPEVVMAMQGLSPKAFRKFIRRRFNCGKARSNAGILYRRMREPNSGHIWHEE